MKEVLGYGSLVPHIGEYVYPLLSACDMLLVLLLYRPSFTII
jgi:hypothetical protein